MKRNNSFSEVSSRKLANEEKELTTPQLNYNNFFLKLFKLTASQSKNDRKNIALDFKAIQSAMSMIYEATGGKTKDSLDAQNFSTKMCLQNLQPPPSYFVVSVCLIQKGDQVFEDYERVLQSFDKIHSNMSFGVKSIPSNAQEVGEINAWAEEKGCKNLLSENSHEKYEDMRLVFFSKAELSSKWAKPFKYVLNKAFHIKKNGQQEYFEIPMMIKYGENVRTLKKLFGELNCTAYKFTYKDGNCMIVIIPKCVASKEELIENVIPNMCDINECLQDEGRDKHYAEIEMPKFACDSKIDLNPIFEKCEETAPLVEKGATLTRVTQNCHDNPPIYSLYNVSVSVKNHEEGTDVHSLFEMCMADGIVENTIMLNRPFVFSINGPNSEMLSAGIVVGSE